MGVAVPAMETVPFDKASMVRRVHREAVVLLGGGRALLMQVAHPEVAAGVAEHSSFRDRRLGRLQRTLRPTLAIVFGTKAQMTAAAASINRAHARVVGKGYDAGDPDLLFWVLATLIDTALLMHARFLRPLTEAEAERYYAEMLDAGALLGVRRERAPAGIEAFRAYMSESVAMLAVTDAAREIAADMFRPSPLAAWALLWPLRQLSAGLLPARLRREYGLSWGPGRERALDAMCAASRALLPRLPPPLRAPPRLVMPPPA